MPDEVLPNVVNENGAGDSAVNMRPGAQGQSVLDSIFSSDAGDDGAGGEGTPAAAPIAATPPTTPPAPPAVDPLAGIPKSLLGVKDEPAAPAAPAAPAVKTPDYAAEDAAYDKETEKTAARFNNIEQKRAFFSVRNEAKAEKIRAREAHAKLQEMSAKMQEVEQRLAKAAVAGPVAAPAAPTPETLVKLQELEKKNAEYEEKIGRLDLTQSEGFQKQFSEPRKMLANKLVKLLTSSNRPAEQANVLAQEILKQGDRDEQLAMIAESPMAVQGAVLNILEDFSEIAENERIAIDNWKLSKAAVAEEQARKSKLAFVHNVMNNTAEAAQALVQEGNFLLAPVEGNAAWNQAIEQRINAAQGILQSADDKTLVKMVLDGVTAPYLRQAYLTLHQEFQKLQRDASSLVRGAGNIAPTGAPAVTPPAVPRPATAKAVLDNVFGEDER